ncbi:hypothetical protein [Methylobacterium sp. C1]|uniref:hypothetical protein n=1 Tax=Methylobacterium sp. C1 TaxID=1479019 RepID=UPI0008D98BC6|nr:hypothetical protein [Methylobacterium sp. C1]
MTRIIPAALALACVCSPALAATSRPFDLSRAAGHSVMVLLLGSGLIAALICAARRAPGLMLAAVALVVAVGAGIHPAFAQAAATVAQPATDTAVVTVPLGTWIASYAQAAVELVTAVVMAAITWGLRRLPASIGAVVKGLITQQLVEKAISFGVNTVAGAAKDKTLSFDVGNQVLANALNYVVEHTPGWLLSWTGGVNAIRDHIIALLPVEDGASLATSTPTAAGPTTTAPAVVG